MTLQDLWSRGDETATLQVAAAVDGVADDRVEAAARLCRQIVGWVAERCGGDVPGAARSLGACDWKAGSLDCKTIRAQVGEEDLWGLRLVRSSGGGRFGSRRTEICVRSSAASPARLHARVLVTHGHASGESPGVLPLLASRFRLTQFGAPMRSEHVVIQSEEDTALLVEALEQPSGRLPIIVLSVPEHSEDPRSPLIDPRGLARDTTGIAQVVVLPSRFTWNLTEAVGKRLGVYRGAVRVYMPGFDRERGGSDHWAIMPQRLLQPEDVEQQRFRLLRRVGQRSLVDQKAGPSFAELRRGAEAGAPGELSASDASSVVGGRSGLSTEEARPVGEPVEDLSGESVPSEGDAPARGPRERGDDAVPAFEDTESPRRADPSAAAARDPGGAGEETFVPAADARGTEEFDAALGHPVGRGERQSPGGPAPTSGRPPDRTSLPMRLVAAFRALTGADTGRDRRVRELKRQIEEQRSARVKETGDNRNLVEELRAELEERRLNERAALDLADDAEDERNRLLDQVRGLKRQLREAGVDPDEARPLPTVWTGFAEWSEAVLGARVRLSPGAKNELKKARYADVETVAQVIEWLGGEYRDGRIHGQGDDLRVPLPGLHNRRCGADSFEFLWGGRKRRVEWHVKNGGNTRDPARCLRIYYWWDDKRREVVIASMPGHRRSGAT